VNSSITTRIRKRRPSAATSETKSIAQRSLGLVAAGSSVLAAEVMRLRSRRRERNHRAGMKPRRRDAGDLGKVAHEEVQLPGAIQDDADR